jgi:hypothetical protein
VKLDKTLVVIAATSLTILPAEGEQQEEEKETEE